MVGNKKETVEVHRCIRKYPWLMEMVKSKLFHELCDIHITNQRCYFCCDCMSVPLCPLCFKKSDHKGHTTIQTFRSSFHSGVRKDDVSKFIELSDIQLYSINGKQIVYIHQRPRRSNDNHRHRNNVSRKCETCKWELDAASSASYCSIECKFRSVLGSELEDLMENSESLEETTQEQKSEVEKPAKKEPAKKKQHRRKGYPQRSGFFGLISP